MPVYPANFQGKRWPTTEEKGQYVFDRNNIEKTVFDPFQDAGEMMRDFQTAEDLSNAQGFWRNEAHLEDRGAWAIR